jgi:cytochrome P450
MLMDARDESSGEAMTDAQLRDEVMTLLLAGHETTANALTWAFYLLALNPDVLERVEAEVDEVLAQRPPSFRDLGNLTYCTMVLQETLRLYPPAYALARTAVADDVVGGYHVDAGASITLSPYLTHRHPAFWEQPDHFDPERFRSERSAERHRYAYIPFGAGPRKCIGNNFAMTEGVLIMAMVAQRYRLALQPGHPVALEPLITLRPRYGIKMIATRRHRARRVDR